MKTPFLVAALSATALFGQTAGQSLEGRIEVFGEFTRPRQVTYSNVGGNDLYDQAESQHGGGGLRLMGELPGTQGWYYLLGGKLESSSKMAFNDHINGGASAVLDTRGVSIRHSYWTVGLSRMIDLGGGLTIGVHGEARGEALTAVGDVYLDDTKVEPSMNVSTTYLRPWLRASLDWTFRRSGMSPYLGFDAGVPLIKTSQDGAVAPTMMTSNTLKSMAPGVSFNVYAGLRF